jgi:hypothetical protein
LPVYAVLQIIVIQLSFLIWLTSALHKSDGVQVIGLMSALVLAVIGLVQGAQMGALMR